MKTETIIKNGYEHTIVEVPDRPRTTRIDGFGKCTTSITPQPNYDGRRNMALKSVRRLTRSELMVLKIKAETLKHEQV